MYLFMPKTVIFEPVALEYPLGEKIYKYFENKQVEILKTSLGSFSKKLSDLSERQRYAKSKTVLAVTRNRGKKLEVCRPSADFQFALVSNCPGSCEYCYLQTNQAYKPYLKAYVNLDEIWEVIESHIIPDQTNPTTFEAASNGDPLAIEHITGSVRETIKYFAGQEKVRLRIVTKYNNVDYVLNADHNGHTRFRISINGDYVIKQFEHNTSTIEERLEAARKLAEAKYPLGFIVAPIMMHEDWETDYKNMFARLYNRLKDLKIDDLSFELIQHRYTDSAKRRILERYPNTKLDMDDERRELKWGKFGRYKYIYKKEDVNVLKKYMSQMIDKYFPDASIQYFT